MRPEFRDCLILSKKDIEILENMFELNRILGNSVVEFFKMEPEIEERFNEIYNLEKKFKRIGM